MHHEFNEVKQLVNRRAGTQGLSGLGELVVDGITAVELELRPDLSIGAALAPPGGNAGGVAARELGTHAPPGRQCRDGS